MSAELGAQEVDAGGEEMADVQTVRRIPFLPIAAHHQNTPLRLLCCISWAVIECIPRLAVQDAELEAMKAKLADMEKEAAKLQEMQVSPHAPTPANPTLRRRRRFPT